MTATETYAQLKIGGMLPYDRQNWLEQRRLGIGGSDWTHIGQYDYGCRLFLWWDKRGHLPDYEQEVTGPMQRGHSLEPNIGELVWQKYGGKLKRVHKQPRKAREALPEWWLGNIDYGLYGVDGLSPCVVECKSTGPTSFRKIVRDGPPGKHIAQGQHYAAYMGWDNIILAYLEPLSWDFITFELERDDELLNWMREAGDFFWKQVTEGPRPERLPFYLGRKPEAVCKTCVYRKTCLGDAVVEEMAGLPDRDKDVETVENDKLLKLMAEDRELSKLEHDVAEQRAEIKQAIKDELGEPKKVACGDGRAYWVRRSTKRQDRAGLWREVSKTDKALVEKYTVDSVYESLRVY
jgi:predicted phage-related endonuclease